MFGIANSQCPVVRRKRDRMTWIAYFPGLTIVDRALATSFENADLLFPPRFRDVASAAWETEHSRLQHLLFQVREQRSSPEFRRRLYAEGLYGAPLRLKYQYLTWAFDNAKVRVGEDEGVRFADLLGLSRDGNGLWVSREIEESRSLWDRLRERMHWPTRARSKEILIETITNGEPLLDSGLQCIPVLGNAIVEVKDVAKGLLGGRSRERPSREQRRPSQEEPA